MRISTPQHDCAKVIDNEYQIIHYQSLLTLIDCSSQRDRDKKAELNSKHILYIVD